MAGRDLQARVGAAVAEVVASTLRHDLRNKLASIRNASFYLMRQVKKTDLWSADPRVETFFQLIDKELTSAEEVLSTRAPPPPGGARPRCSARVGVEHALAEAQVPPSVEVVRDLTEQGGVPLEAEDLALLVRCLVDNALEAMPRGGTLTVRTRDADSGVCLRVEDTGEGLAPEAYSRALEPCFSTRPRLGGLGLCIVHRTAVRHGWQLDLGAGPAGGTYVEIQFTGSEAGAHDRNDVTRGSK